MTIQTSAELLLEMHRRLETLPPRRHERWLIKHDTTCLSGISEPKLVRRVYRGMPRVEAGQYRRPTA